MLKSEFNLKPLLPFDRVSAALLAQTASHFESLITLERDGVVLNAKSMLGLLSQHAFGDGMFTLIADGEDEKEATQALLELIR